MEAHFIRTCSGCAFTISWTIWLLSAARCGSARATPYKALRMYVAQDCSHRIRPVEARQLNNGKITGIDFLYPGSLNGSVWEVLKSFDDDMPGELVLNFALSINQTSGQLVIIANAFTLGLWRGK